MKMMSWLSILVVALFTQSVFAETSPERLTGLLSELKTMRAQFTQRVVDSKGKVIQESNGQMALQRPGRFRWDTLSTGQQIVADGKKVWIYDSELQQVTVQKQDTNSVRSPAFLLSGDTQNITRKFKITALQRKEAGEWFELKPISKDASFRAVQLQFVKGQLQSMQLSDAMGHTSHLTFSRVETNLTLPASLFRFRVPQGVDVVNQG